MARIERATSPLPRECSTTEPHGHRYGAGHMCFFVLNPVATIALERETGIEPASLAWKAKVLPLNYSRGSLSRYVLAWWRRLDSNQRRRKPTDLQSAPFSHSGTPPRRTGEYSRGFHTPEVHSVECPVDGRLTLVGQKAVDRAEVAAPDERNRPASRR